VIHFPDRDAQLALLFAIQGDLEYPVHSDNVDAAELLEQLTLFSWR
jgi:hypothetical protein